MCCNRVVPPAADSLPDDIATLKAMVIAAQAARLEAEAKARNMEAEVRARELLIEQMKFTIKKLRHEQFGQSSERHAVLEQLELSLAEMEEDASQAEAAAQIAATAAARANIKVAAFERRKPARRPLPDHLPHDASSIRRRRSARAVGAFCTSSGRTSPRHWKWFRGSGR
jgi:transposase